MYSIVPERLNDDWTAFCHMLRAQYVECAYKPCYGITIRILKNQNISNPSWLDRLDAAMGDPDALCRVAEQIALEWDGMHTRLCRELRPERLPLAGMDNRDFEGRALHYAEGGWAEPLVAVFLKMVLQNGAPGRVVGAVECLAAEERQLMAEFTGVLERAHVRYNTHYKLDELVEDYGADSEIVALRQKHDETVRRDYENKSGVPVDYRDDMLACLLHSRPGRGH
ncbi:hypothetical protein GC177_06410 [bacterium]|nr:hypothetical protein [bacterium]